MHVRIILGHPVFFGRDPSSRAKTKKIKMNDFHSPELGGGAPTASKLWGQVDPTAPPPPPVPASLDVGADEREFFLVNPTYFSNVATPTFYRLHFVGRHRYFFFFSFVPLLL